jgi:hypothetical protein
MRVPNIIHFIFGLNEDFGNKEFSLVHYLAIRSAYELNQPDKIYFHFRYEPRSIWFEMVRPFIHMNKVDPPKEILGNKLYHFAHQADIIRLEALLTHGGVYLDIDTISVKSLVPLRNYSFAIGKQYAYSSSPLRRRIKKSVTNLNLQYLKKPVRGLCNAVILSEPGSLFAAKWYDSYKTFRSGGVDEYWDEHSVIMPLKLAKEFPRTIQILDAEYFHYPLHDETGLKFLFEEKRVFPKAYIHHLWESKSWDKYLSHLSVEGISSIDTTYNLIARKYLDPHVFTNSL